MIFLHSFNNIFARYYDLKLRELNHEISLVEKGIHPEFIKESMNLDSMKAAELKKAENKLRHSVHSCEDTFEGCVKAANDTFTVYLQFFYFNFSFTE